VTDDPDDTTAPEDAWATGPWGSARQARRQERATERSASDADPGPTGPPATDERRAACMAEIRAALQRHPAGKGRAEQ